MCDVLDIQQFKSYFGQSKAKLDATLARLRNNANNRNNGNNGNNNNNNNNNNNSNQPNNNLSQASIRIIEFCDQEGIPEAADQLIQMNKDNTITALKHQLDINHVHYKSSWNKNQLLLKLHRHNQDILDTAIDPDDDEHELDHTEPTMNILYEEEIIEIDSTMLLEVNALKNKLNNNMDIDDSDEDNDDEEEMDNSDEDDDAALYLTNFAEPTMYLL
jgi:hypothetical protein